MTETVWQTRRIATEREYLAPDGSEVRVLAGTTRGSMAQFTLPPQAVSRAMAHRTVEEVWYFLSGHGRMWRRAEQQEEVVEVGPGVSLSIPVGTRFQFRSDTAEPLIAVGTTMPPWPGDGEAYPVEGCWPPTV
jgi:mannose-6-phosphate isomerase-like protein (cupin superfamily)